MTSPTTLTALDAALRQFREEADFADARYGHTVGAGLRHSHDEMTRALTVAFVEVAQANDLSLSKRDRAGLIAHSQAIANALEADLAAVNERFRKAVSGFTPSSAGARGLMETAVARGKVAVDKLWEGRLRLGPLTSTAIANRPWREFRPLPTWVPWTFGGAAVVSVVTPTVLMILL